MKIESKPEYDDYNSCNKCGGVDNKITDEVYVESHLAECGVECSECGFVDHWAYGFYESSSYMISKCNKYSFK